MSSKKFKILEEILAARRYNRGKDKKEQPCVKLDQEEFDDPIKIVAYQQSSEYMSQCRTAGVWEPPAEGTEMRHCSCRNHYVGHINDYYRKRFVAFEASHIIY